MSTTIREALACLGGQGGKFMGKRLALLAIRLLVHEPLYAAIFLKFAGCRFGPVHADVASGPRWYLSRIPLGSGMFETVWRFCS